MRLASLEQAKQPKAWPESSDDDDQTKGEVVDGRSSVKEHKYASDREYWVMKKNKTTSAAERISSANTTVSVGPILRKSNLPSITNEKLKENGLDLLGGSKQTANRPQRLQEEYKFKWVRPEKPFDKYGPPKITIFEDVNTHNHLKTHKLNIFFDQYNEFVRHVFKN
jgi:hypothetical protein